VGTRKKLSFYI